MIEENNPAAVELGRLGSLNSQGPRREDDQRRGGRVYAHGGEGSMGEEATGRNGIFIVRANEGM